MKYDLSDWEERRRALMPLITEAAQAGLVAEDKSSALVDFLTGRGVMIGTAPQPVLGPRDPGSLDTLVSSEPTVGLEESEAPRFIRGFHDVLITLGVLIGLTGLGGLWTIYAIIPAVIVLSEVLVRRQRLALPAVVLSLAFAGSSSFAAMSLLEDQLGDWEPTVMTFTPFVMLSLYYWRYRAPIAFALAGITGFGALAFGIGALLMQWTGNKLLFVNHPMALSALMGLFAALAFGTALYHDLSDPRRQTRRSDVAFWLHLAAAPALLYTVISLVFAQGHANLFSDGATLGQAVTIVIAVVVLMLTGIVLDRRAFVTSGLLSFGYAFKILLDRGGVTSLFSSSDTIAFVILLAVGVVVLTLGIGWQWLRRKVLGALPEAVRARLPRVF